MKNTRKPIALLLALILTLGCLTAWAEEPELPEPSEQGESAEAAEAGEKATLQSVFYDTANAFITCTGDDGQPFDVVKGNEGLVSWTQKAGEDPVITINTDLDNPASDSAIDDRNTNDGSEEYDNGINHTVVVNGNVSSKVTGIKSENTTNGKTTTIEVHGDIHADQSGVLSKVEYIDRGASNHTTVTGDVHGGKIGVFADGDIDNEHNTVVVRKDEDGNGGNVTSDGTGVCIENGGGVTVEGNVTGGSVGVIMNVHPDCTDDPKPQGSVIVEGTVSGKEKAIQFAGTFDGTKYNLGDATLLVWAANTNGSTDSVAHVYDADSELYISDGEPTPAIQSEGDQVLSQVEPADAQESAVSEPAGDNVATDGPSAQQVEAAKAALKQAVQYIIKFKDNVVLDGDTRTYVANAEKSDEKTYYVAREDEDVKFTAALDEGEVIDDVYYYDGEDSQKTATYEKSGDSFIVKMLRGGGMLLGLKTHKHDYSVFVKTVKKPTCTEAGSDLYQCKYCDKTTEKPVAATGHKAGAKQEKNRVEAKPGVAGGYDWEIHCTVCDALLDSGHETLPALPTPTATATATPTPTATATPTPTATATPTPTPTATATATPTPAPSEQPEPSESPKPAGQKKKVLVYSKVDSWRGLNPAEHPGMRDALKKIAQSIDAQGAAVRMWYLDEGVLVPADLLAAFDALSLEDRLLILMELLGCGEAEGLSEEGEQVLADIHAAIDAMTPEQQAARQADVDKHFLPRSVTDENGVEHKSVGIELEIQEGAKLSYERYTFYEDADEWKLFSIETGTYREA